MRPEAVRQALRSAAEEGRSTTIHLNDGSRLPVKSREHWFITPDYLYILVGRTTHHVAFRNIATVAVKASRRREKAG
jgi:hypothetical protein